MSVCNEITWQLWHLETFRKDYRIRAEKFSAPFSLTFFEKWIFDVENTEKLFFPYLSCVFFSRCNSQETGREFRKITLHVEAHFLFIMNATPHLGKFDRTWRPTISSHTLKWALKNRGEQISTQSRALTVSHIRLLFYNAKCYNRLYLYSRRLNVRASCVSVFSITMWSPI